MDIYFTDRKFNILGMASTSLPEVLYLYNDSEKALISDAGKQFEGELEYNVDRGIITDGIVEVGNFILFEDENKKSQWYTIMKSEVDVEASTAYFYAESAGLDLLNEIAPEYKADKAYDVAFYVNRFTADSGFQININEIPNLKRTLEWTGQDTATKRILSVANYFDGAEIDFSFRIEKMQLTGKYINIYKQRGKNANMNLRMGHEVQNIRSIRSIENLLTAVFVSGGTLEGQENPINLIGYKYDDGRFSVDKDGIILDRLSNRQWSRYITNTQSTSDKAGYILGRKTDYTTTDKKTLLEAGISYLKKMCEVEQSWEVDLVELPDGIDLGDTVNVVDENDEIYLSSRILQIEKRRGEGKNIALLGDFEVLDSGINQKVRDLADKVASIPRGDTFYPWVRYANDELGNGFSSNPIGKSYMAVVYGKNNPVPSENPSDYAGKWVKIQGGQGEPGPNGEPTYTWVKYGDNVNGDNMSDNPSGKKYIGIAVNQKTPDASTNPKDYKWSLIQGDTTYFFQAWANSATGSVDFSTTVSLGKKFMGTYSSTNPVQSNLASDYKWNSTANNVEVGAVNLMNSTNPMRDFSPYKSAVLTLDQNYPAPEWGTGFATRVRSTGGGSTLKFVKGSSISPSKNGQQYMFSGYVKNNSDSNLTLTFNNLAANLIIAPRTAQFVKVPLLGNGASNAQVGFASVGAIINLDVTVWRFQIETGNVATDYKPSEAELAQVTTELSEKVAAVKYPIVSATQPEKGIDGQQWWQTNASNDVTGYFVYDSGKTPPWVPQVLQQGILNVTDLNAVRITGSEITGTNMIGSTFTSNFTKVEGDLTKTGVMEMDDGELTILVDVFAGGVLNAKANFTIDPMAITNFITAADGSPTSSYSLTGSGLELNAETGSAVYGNDKISQTRADKLGGVDYNFGNEGFQVKPRGSIKNVSFELFGRTPFIDFHSNNWTTNDYDNRIIATGGNGQNGNGTLTFNGWYHNFITPASGNPGIRITSASLESINSQDIRVGPGPVGSALIVDPSGNWRPIKASAFNVNSDRDSKKNIETVENFADKLRGVKVYNYNLKSEHDWELKNTGMMMQEVPVELISPTGAIDIYSVGSMAVGLGLENLEKIEKLETEVEELKSELEDMRLQMLQFKQFMEQSKES